jgi:hypothetical protein
MESNYLKELFVGEGRKNVMGWRNWIYLAPKREYLEQVKNHHLLKKDCAACSWLIIDML